MTDAEQEAVAKAMAQLMVREGYDWLIFDQPIRHREGGPLVLSTRKPIAHPQFERKH